MTLKGRIVPPQETLLLSGAAADGAGLNPSLAAKRTDSGEV